MPKLCEYLSSLKILRNQLAKNISAKGVSAFENERLNTLVPKVLDISGAEDVAKGSWMPLASVEEFKVENINFLPARVAVSCDEVLNGSITSTKDYTVVALLNINEIDGSKTLYPVKDNALGTDDAVEVQVEITENNGTYSVLISFVEANQKLLAPYKFKANYAYNWVISSEGWEIE